jgi:hypothetical protein
MNLALVISELSPASNQARRANWNKTTRDRGWLTDYEQSGLPAAGGGVVSVTGAGEEGFEFRRHGWLCGLPLSGG